MLFVYFDFNKEADLASKIEIGKQLKELLQLEDAATYSVILHNDPIVVEGDHFHNLSKG